MDRKHEQGSVVTVIIVITVVVLISVVGYVLLSKLKLVPAWRFGASSKDAAKVDDRPRATFDKSFGIDMSFRYPKTWNIDKKHSGTFPVTANTTSIETYTLTAPDKTYSVVYRLGAGGGVGGTCDEATAPTIVAADSEDVKGWLGVKFVRAITKTKDGKYLTKVGLMPTLFMYKLKTGQSACRFGPGTTDVPSMTLRLTLLDASIHGKSDMNILSSVPSQGLATEKEARAMFSGKTYDEAKVILLSTTLK